MTQEEKFLKQQFGKENPFKVPEGYFADFSSDLMDKLPQKETRVVKMTPTFMQRSRPFMYAAVLAAVAIFTASIFFNNKTQDDVQVATTENMMQQQPSVSDEQVDDYLMLDNEDIYAYVAGY